ncbi:hypothetical protein J8L73_06435 [Pseudoalteromonas sp. MMG006]|uniref:hypothetical protein n=1 Tax=unclassified Pseudoalteromonas TaxID=194690 RepID=UPI001B35C257|nr:MULTISPECIES: hypothetical protein [unclassified Pseudoalteromonas]MBQ4798766.1 hypothetical protein [Pseudoalteromonas sp. MMG006]
MQKLPLKIGTTLHTNYLNTENNLIETPLKVNKIGIKQLTFDDVCILTSLGCTLA